MKIKRNTLVSEINESFIQAFPYLKLVFYKKSHGHFVGSMKKDEIDEDVAVEALNPEIQDGVVEWKGEMSVDKLETYLEESFGLHVQIFRKSGDLWLQTSVTDHWTLDEQNTNAAQNEKFATH
ncbi:MAG: hypothetical protein AAGA77_23125 [Bacteroidota bacterium]